MKRIGLISDTHGYFDKRIAHHLQDLDEIWHAGDFGPSELILRLVGMTSVFRGVYGNADGMDVRFTEPLVQDFTLEGMHVVMTHIGGYPGHYAPAARQLIAKTKPDLFVCGHSHILRVMPDPKHNMLVLNPGAAGRQGLHKVRTMLRFGIDRGQVVDLQAIELGPRTTALDIAS